MMQWARLRLDFVAACGALWICLLAAPAAWAVTRYVDDSSGSPLSPYTNSARAATTIQAAIDVAAAGDVILVSDGLYASGGRVVYGGLTNRVALNKAITVRSVNGPAATIIRGAGPLGDAAVRCAYVTNGAALIGFTLTNGFTRADGAPPEDWDGGGVWCEKGAMVSNCVLSGNSAFFGGGGAMGSADYLGNGGASLYDCLVTGNTAISGGGIYAAYVHGGRLADNASNAGGGAFRSRLYGCRIERNSADAGGGVYNAYVYGCILAGNYSYNSGGGASGSYLFSSLIIGNEAVTEGGGADGGVIDHCTVVGNSALYGGGLAQVHAISSIVYDNTALHGANWDERDRFFTANFTCTTPLPPGTGNISNAPTLASASHLAANSPCLGRGSSSAVSGVDIDGEAWGTPPSMGCDELRISGATGLVSVAIAAPATNIAVGHAASFVADIGGRVTGSVWTFGDGTVISNRPFVKHAWSAPGTYAVALRAFNTTYPAGIAATVMVSVVAQPVHYANPASVAPAWPYGSWATAARTLQEAVDAATIPGALVLATNGVYAVGGRPVAGSALTNRVTVLRAITVRSVNGPVVTTIRGAGSLGDTGVRCAHLANGAVLAGFTLTDGRTRIQIQFPGDNSGGGAWCAPLAVMSNCIVTFNQADWSGGGVNGGSLFNCFLAWNDVEIYGGGAYDSALYDCGVSSNNADLGGGGGGGGRWYGCELEGNRAVIGGGAYGGRLENCRIRNNTARDDGFLSGRGGGVAAEANVFRCMLQGNQSAYGAGADSSLLYDCVLTGNIAASEGGGARQSSLYNCTVMGNSAGSKAGGVVSGLLYNSIVYDNTAPAFANAFSQTMAYCCTTPLADGTGNITNAPAVVDATGGNFRLRPDSPCVDRGSDAYALTSTDLDGNRRIMGLRVDIGAYEVPIPPTLAVAPLVLSPSIQLGQVASGQVFSVWNNGIGSLAYTNAADVSWLAVSPPTGISSGEVDVIQVNYATAGMPVGIYTGRITVAAGSISNSPQVVTVRLSVLAPPTLSRSPATLAAACRRRRVAPSQELEVWNSGSGSLAYTTSASAYWLRAVPFSGSSTGEHDIIRIEYSTGELASGVHNAVISITPSGTPGPAQTVAVTLTVLASHGPGQPDCDGDGKADMGVYFPQNGNWYLRQSRDAQTFSGGPVVWGGGGALPVPGDYDGDELTDIATYTPNEGRWRILRSLDDQTQTITLGGPGQLPVLADYDGDGRADPAVFKSATGEWFIQQSSTGGLLGNGPLAFGWNGTIPVPGDYDGDGRADVGVFWRESGLWYVQQSSNGAMLGGAPQAWGWASNLPVPGDYDGDGRTDIAVYDPPSGGWYVRESSTGATLSGGGIAWGAPVAYPVPSDYDGDGKTDIAVYVPRNGKWYIRESRTGTLFGGGSTAADGYFWGHPRTQPLPTSASYQTLKMLGLVP